MSENNQTPTVLLPLQFIGVFLVIFFVLCAVLFIVDFVPEAPAPEENVAAEEEVENVVFTETYPVEAPVRVVVPKVGIDTVIVNPVESNIDALDTALLEGAVRYPASALLGENASMFLFGHQSYLPVIKNQAFKAFNGLQDLEVGDEVRVFSENAVYVYHVRSVMLANAEDTLVSLEEGSRTLTLSTCNSFGDKSERYVVTADFVSRAALPSDNS